MFQRKPRGFRRRSNGRGRGSHENGFMQSRQRSNSFSNNQIRNNFRHTQSAEKLFEKYTALAKEAMSSGDKTLGENYLQHADHFMRVIEEKNKNRIQNKTEFKPIDDKSKLPEEKQLTEKQNLEENKDNKTSE